MVDLDFLLVAGEWGAALLSGTETEIQGAWDHLITLVHSKKNQPPDLQKEKKKKKKTQIILTR